MITVNESIYKEMWIKLKSNICDNMIEAIKVNDHESSRLYSSILKTMADLDKDDRHEWLMNSYVWLQERNNGNTNN